MLLCLPLCYLSIGLERNQKSNIKRQNDKSKVKSRERLQVCPYNRPVLTYIAGGNDYGPAEIMKTALLASNTVGVVALAILTFAVVVAGPVTVQV
jgi:hypothetical protein